MAAPTQTYIDPADGASAGNDHGGNAFVDGSFANATNTLTKIGAFTAATCQAGDKIYVDDNGSGEVAAGLYTISVRTDNDNVVLTADIRSGAPDPTDVRCDQHTGTVALPWATVQHALDFTTRDAANGDRFNVKEGTDDVLAASLSFTSYGTPASGAQWICQGYTAASGDGGVGGISGDGLVSIVTISSLDYIVFIDMHLHNCGAAPVLNLDNYCGCINCEIDNTTGDGLNLDLYAFVVNCYIHNIGAGGVEIYSGTVMFNTFENGANDFTYAISGAGVIAFNIIDIDGSSSGIYANSARDAPIVFNSVYGSAGTGNGIFVGAAQDQAVILNNMIEGFSGINGKGVHLLANSTAVLYGHNKFYNNTAHETITGDILFNLGNNDVLLASPFTNPAGGDFTVSTELKAKGWPTDFMGISTDQFLDVGAAQREEAGAGATVGWW